jgi:hypothetical protein
MLSLERSLFDRFLPKLSVQNWETESGEIEDRLTFRVMPSPANTPGALGALLDTLQTFGLR